MLYDRPIPKLTLDKGVGYLYFYDPQHPLANKAGKVYYHRHVASLARGRWLRSDEHVHHKDEDRLNNAPGNLDVMTCGEHVQQHHGKKPERPCAQCGKTTKNLRYCSTTCARLRARRAERPSKEALAALIETHSWCAIGRMFGVTDNAIRKWARAYELL